MTFAKIPNNGKIGKVMWYNHYKMTEQEYETWKEWALAQLEPHFPDEKERKEAFMQLDLLYGFILTYKKKGELF